jgi:hypothetical protein
MIKLDIKVGDVIMGGKFKNKKVVVKSIGKNDKGDITINGKPLLRFRIIDQEKNNEELTEKWSEKYKKSIDCNNPKGFSQRAHCQGRKKK